MAHILFLVPSGRSVGLTSIALGLVHALDERGIRVAFCKPIGQSQARDTGPERSTHFVSRTTSLRPAPPVPLDEAERMIGERRTDELLDRVFENFKRSAGDADVVVVEGLVHTPDSPIEDELNRQLVQALSASVIVVAAQRDMSIEDLEQRLRVTAGHYGDPEDSRVVGCIVNRVPDQPGVSASALREQLSAALARVAKRPLRLVGVIPENPELCAVRTIDVARWLDARVLHEGDIQARRVRRFTLLARTVPNLISSLTPGSLLLTPGDRSDVVVAVAMAAAKEVPIAGLVLTGDLEVPPQVLELCSPALQAGLPLMSVPSASWDTTTALVHMSSEVPVDDLERVRSSTAHVVAYVDTEWFLEWTSAPSRARMSPAAFCHRLVEVASRSSERIVLPEGTEPRTIKAAIQCTNRKIARCVLLGDPKQVQDVAQGLELTLPEGLEILDPAELRARYVEPLTNMRKHKGVTEREAAEMLEDNVWLGTVMLALGEVNGLVSGAVHSTANTIRPALQIIKTKPDARAVSSVFFMCLPEQVVVYGDCAVNPDPDAELLADIAIQSAESAASFGIEPRVAMISYSTGNSGSGADVDKVREATRLARERRPDLLIDGPMQYDAAEDAGVAATKAPDSPVAGRATVFVFPDLNTGNTTYKAVQRSANVVSIGPMLQGMKRPVNDLSRGALVEDIVYTIAITAIQAAVERAHREGPAA